MLLRLGANPNEKDGRGALFKAGSHGFLFYLILIIIYYIYTYTFLWLYVYICIYMFVKHCFWCRKLRYCTFTCTCTHAGCYATVRSLALARMLDATLLYVHLHLRPCWMLCCCTFNCSCARHMLDNAGCYVLYIHLQLRTAAWSCRRDSWTQLCMK